MKKTAKTAGVALMLICATVGLYSPHASAATLVHSVDCTFEPLAFPKGPGPVKLELAFTPKHSCEEVTVKVTKLLNLEYTGDTAWVVQVEKEKWYRKTLNVSIAANDTSGIELTLQCGRVPNEVACYFVTTGDTLEFYRGNPRGWIRLPQPHREIDSTKYDFVIDLRDSVRFEFVKKHESLLGPITPTSKQGFFRLRTTLELARKLRMEGFKCELLEDFLRGSPDSSDSSPETKSRPDSLEKQDTGDGKFKSNSFDGFSLDYVDGSGAINMADLTYLVDYLFFDGADPALCP